MKLAKQHQRDTIMTNGNVTWIDYNKTDRKGTTPQYMGGTALFRDLNLSTLQILIQKGFAQLDEAQNEGKTIQEILAFMQKYPRFQAEGYVVTQERNDFRLTITGVTLHNPTNEEKIAFSEMFHNADEYENSDKFLRSWYD